MKRKEEKIFFVVVKSIAFLSVAILCLILLFILKESLPIFKNTSLFNFILNNSWNVLEDSSNFSIFNFIVGTFYVTFVAVIIAMPIGVCCSIFLSNIAPSGVRKILKPFIDMLSGIPSVVYGFIGLSVLVKFFEDKFSMSQGECVLSAGIILAIMILPFIISNCTDTMIKVYNKYYMYSKALGVSKWYMLNNLVIRASKKAILASTILAVGRGMGETMAVMMVMGNSPIFPKLLGKGETIPSLIALEMGSSQVGSMHYHALFASGFVLMIILLIINTLFYKIKKSIDI
ncbi:phosphate ABC transporter permease subunit PstC [Clostridium oceanicum]|uniref:Phosphate transport system permease protein n=1 Tax=Clostridium oceanicum TaxID=1543 RepID=A0ABN1JRX5_9CLOT